MSRCSIVVLVIVGACNGSSPPPPPSAVDAPPAPDGSVAVAVDAAIADAAPGAPDGAVVAPPDGAPVPPDAYTGPLGWVAQSSGTTARLRDVWFTDASRGWVVGWDGTLRRTTDGGVTWTAQDSGVTTANLVKIVFADALHGWIVGDKHQPDGQEVLLATSDGGETWSVRATISGTDLAFVSPTTGWIAAGSIYRTDDGGATWQLQLSGTAYHSIELVDASHGWALGRDGDDDANIVVRTSDGGATWQQQLAVGDYNTELLGLDAVSPTVAWVVGDADFYTRLGEYKFVSRDGTTWSGAPDTSNGTSLRDVELLDSSFGWAVGYGGSVIHTADGGATWSVQEIARWEYDSSGDHTNPTQPTLHGVHFLDADTGWAVGEDGTILVTHNGGRPD